MKIVRCDGEFKGSRFCLLSIDGEHFIDVQPFDGPLGMDDVATLERHQAGNGNTKPMLVTRRYLELHMETSTFSDVVIEQE